MYVWLPGTARNARAMRQP